MRGFALIAAIALNSCHPALAQTQHPPQHAAIHDEFCFINGSGV